MSDRLPPGLFDSAASFDPAGDLDAFARQVPARWVVYLLADADDRPVQLLCVRNLRASLKRRLGLDLEATPEPSRRVDYRALVRRVHWRRVDSGFEADWHYYEAARQLFPKTYAGMVGFRPAWFVHVDPDAAFPRYVRTTDLSPRPGLTVGPIENKQQAAALVELMEDAFDLCRYYNILVQAPHGQACAYKEMGKCPAPCDGSVSVGQYRRLVELSGRVLVDPADAVREQTRRMQQAAAELRFETAGKVKAYVDQLSQLGRGPYRHAAALADFQYLSVQRGPRTGTAKTFLVTPGRIEPLVSVVGEPVRPAEVPAGGPDDGRRADDAGRRPRRRRRAGRHRRPPPVRPGQAGVRHLPAAGPGRREGGRQGDPRRDQAGRRGGRRRRRGRPQGVAGVVRPGPAGWSAGGRAAPGRGREGHRYSMRPITRCPLARRR